MVKNPPANAGDVGLISGSGRSPAGGNGNSFQYSCLENPLDRGALWGTSPQSHKELDMTEHADTHYIDISVRNWSTEICRQRVLR